LIALKSPLACAAISVRATSPEFVRTTCCAELEVLNCCGGNVRVSGERASVAGEVPTPLKEAVWVPTSSVILKVPLRVPDAVGVKAIAMVHPVLGPRVGPHVFAVIEKSEPLMVGF
jgi:hypothetical protein